MIDEKSKRLFFGAHVEAPWPKHYPSARMIDEKTRHITLAFLGEQLLSKWDSLQALIPIPSFRLGPVGIADQLVFLPPEQSRVAALSVRWLDPMHALNHYQTLLANWLNEQGYSLDKRPFFPHITLARTPFDQEDWLREFCPLPIFVSAICLYQSLGNLQYEPIWQWPLLPPFEEFEHTADIAFLIRGMSMQELHLHAQLALAFKFPPLVDFLSTHLQNSLNEIIISLNEIVARADTEMGCPFKAISFHGEVKIEADMLMWEMIVDV